MNGRPEAEARPRAGLTKSEAARIMDALQVIRAGLLRIRTRGGDEVAEVAAALAEARPALARLEEVAERLYSS